MMQAESLHREAALLSNELHTFRDEDIEGVKPVIQKIISKRKEWKEQILKVQQYVETGKLPETQSKQTSDASVAQLKVELQLLNQNISNRKKKIRDNPQHPKVENWTAELALLEAHKVDLKKQLTDKKYETA